MNKLICFLTGGHRYADKNIIVYQHPNPDFVKLHNECVKCGKTIEFDFCIGAYLRSEINKIKCGTERFFSPKDVRKMSRADVRENYQDIMRSMKRW